MRLGYERIVKDKRIDIIVEEGDEPWVELKIQGYPETVRLKVSDTTTNYQVPAMQDEIKIIADAVHQAYIVANNAF